MKSVIAKKGFISQAEPIYVMQNMGSDNPHSHEFIELVYVIAGSARHIVDGKYFDVGRGDVFLVDLDSEHLYEDMSEDFSLINCLFDPSFLSPVVADDTTFTSLASQIFASEIAEGFTSFIYLENKGDETVERLFYQLMDEYRDKKVGYLEVMQSLLKILLITIFREQKKEKAPKLITDIMAYIRKKSGQKVSLLELSEAMFFSQAYISKMFKAYTNQNLSDFIREHRYKNVAKKLLDSDDTIEKIMLDEGFNDRKSFYEQFHKIYGCTPKEYRQRILKR